MMLLERGLRALGDIHAAIEDVLGRLEGQSVAGTGLEARIMKLASETLGPDLGATRGSPMTDPRRPESGSPDPSGSARVVRDLLCICVHPTLPVDRQLSMLLRFAFWLPNDAAARVLQIDPSTVGIHLRQSCRRLRAVARRGGRVWTAGNDSHSLGVLKHLDRLRRRGLTLCGASPRIAEALATDTSVYVSVLLDSESGIAKAEAHAFLAELHLGRERARRSDAAGDPGPPLRVRAEPTDDAVAKGLRHLRAAQELGARDRFVWLARIHASYLLATDRADTDWEQLVGLYEGLLRASAPDASNQIPIGSSAA